MTDHILLDFPEPDKLTRKQKRTLILIEEALLFDTSPRAVARYIAEREGVSIWALYKRLERWGFDLKAMIPEKPKPLSEKEQWKLDNPGMKRCSKCKQGKPATAEFFAGDKRGHGILNSQCRDCEREYRRQPHRVAIVRERARAWARANPDKARAMQRAGANNRRARILYNGGTHTAEDIQRQYDSQKGKCWYCGKKVGNKYHVDHRVPLSRGGSNAPENLVVSCPKCNLSKHDRLPHEWCGRLL
jgi:5-methylcytosine-specific restriction endonuclease McrA